MGLYNIYKFEVRALSNNDLLNLKVDEETIVLKNNAQFNVYALYSWCLPNRGEYFLDAVEVPVNGYHIYTVPHNYYAVSGRCYLFYENPNRKSGDQRQPHYSEPFQLLEFNFQDDPPGKPCWNFNISCVDSVGLPVCMQSGNSEVGMNISLSDYNNITKNNCPTVMIPNETNINKVKSYKTVSAYNFVLEYILTGKIKNDNGFISDYINYYNKHISDIDNPYMDTMKIVFYKGISKEKVTSWLYGGTHHRYNPISNQKEDYKYFDAVAALQRGVSYNDRQKIDMFYCTRYPQNKYSKFIHKILNLPVYAFANDDHQDQGGFLKGHEKVLLITACPLG